MTGWHALAIALGFYAVGVAAVAIRLAFEVLVTRRELRSDPVDPRGSASDGRPGPEVRTTPGRAVDHDDCNPFGITRPVRP